ncbi:PHP domain-containing protein [bacterium]|nr:PHP domain-containing protein [candidate division CSSED10-310 bacterium]
MVNVDLHCHCLCSDGFSTPEELAVTLARAGVNVAALTDHDSLGCQIRFQRALRELENEIRFIPGIELGIGEATQYFHFLAYGFDLGNLEFRGYIEWLQRRMRLKNTLWHSTVRLARMALGTTKAEPVQPGDMTLLAEAAAAFDMVHAAGGLVFWAHPLVGDRDLSRLTRILVELKERGLDGIEGYYKPYSPESREMLIELADRHDMLVSGGSDYHGGRRIRPWDPPRDDSPFHFGPTASELETPGVEMPEARFEALDRALERARGLPLRPESGF